MVGPMTSPESKRPPLMPSSPLRRKLRADGHALKPILRIGTNGVTEGGRGADSFGVGNP